MRVGCHKGNFLTDNFVLNVFKASAESVQEEVEEINKQITAMGKGKVEGIKKMMQKTKDAIKEGKKKLLKLANDLKTASRKQKTVFQRIY